MDMPAFFLSLPPSLPISSFITLPDLHCPFIHLLDLHCPFIHLPDFHCSLIPLPDLHCPSIHHHLHLLDLLLQLHTSATLLDDDHHHGPQPSPSPTRTFTQRTAAPLGLSLPPSPGPFYTIYTLSILYISSYTIYVTTTLLDRLSPPGPTLSTEPSPPSNLSILYIPFYTIYIIAALPNPHRLAPGSSPPPFASTDVLRRPPDFLFFLRSNAVYLSYVAHHLSSILRTIYHATYN